MSRKIRVAHIITRMDRGGAPDVVRLLIDQADPTIFGSFLIYGRTQFPTERVQAFLERRKGSTHMIDAMRRDINPFYDIKTFFGLWAFLRRQKFDIVHTHTSKAGFLGRIAARLAGVPLIIHSPHGHDFYGYFRPFASRLVVLAEKFAGQFCDHIHVLTDLEKTDMLQLAVCPEKKIVVIPSGVELGLFTRDAEKGLALRRSLGIPAEASLVGYVGRLEPVKGPKYFIRAAARVQKIFPGVHFLVAGDGALRDRLEKEARRLGVDAVVHFIGWQEDPLPAYSSLDILALPSLNEAVGRSLLEAQASGVAVVASKVGGIPQVIEDGVSGKLIPPRDAKALAEAVVSLLNEPAQRDALARAGCDRAHEMYSDALMVSRFFELYRQAFLAQTRP